MLLRLAPEFWTIFCFRFGLRFNRRQIRGRFDFEFIQADKNRVALEAATVLCCSLTVAGKTHLMWRFRFLDLIQQNKNGWHLK